MSEPAWDSLPIIDQVLRQQLVGNHSDLADDLLTMLKQTLPADIATIKHLAATKQYVTLHQQVHRLHGAVAYCGTPRLKAVLAHIESQLNIDNTQELSHLMEQLDKESEQVLKTK